MFESDVFNRRDFNDNDMSAGAYNCVIGLVLAWGFFLNYVMVKGIDPQAIADTNRWVFFIGYFASCMFGIYLFSKSDNPLVSFIGYNFVVVPFGLVINVIVSQYSEDSNVVRDAVLVTGGVTVIMMMLGAAFPSFFSKISGALGAALICVIIVELAMVFIFDVHHGIIDWIVAFIFCGYIGYDWGRANAIPKTLDNAIDSAASIYIDIINLFIRILRIMGRSRD